MRKTCIFQNKHWIKEANSIDICQTLYKRNEIQKTWEEIQKLKSQDTAHAKCYDNYIEYIYLKGLIYNTNFKYSRTDSTVD